METSYYVDAFTTVLSITIIGAGRVNIDMNPASFLAQELDILVLQVSIPQPNPYVLWPSVALSSRYPSYLGFSNFRKCRISHSRRQRDTFNEFVTNTLRMRTFDVHCMTAR